MTTDNEELRDLKGKEFGEVCALIDGEKNLECTVNKTKSDGIKWSFCFEFQPNEYTETELLATMASTYGPGDYVVLFRAAGAKRNSGSVIRWRKQYAVQAPRMSQVQTDAPTSKESSADAMTRAIDNQTMLLTALLEKVSTPPPSPPPPPPPPTLGDMARELSAVQDLFGKQKSGPEMLRESMELFTMMKEMGGSGDDSILETALKQFGPMIAKGAEAMQHPAPARPANAQASPQKTPPIREAPTASTEPTAEPINDAPNDGESPAEIDAAFGYFAENYLSPALQLAEAKQEPKEVVSYLSRLIGSDPGATHMTGIVISQDDMVERLAARDAAVMDHVAWFDSVADWLAHALWPDVNDAPTPENDTKSDTSGEKSNSQGINGSEPAHNGQGQDDDSIASGNDPNPDTPGPKPGNTP